MNVAYHDVTDGITWVGALNNSRNTLAELAVSAPVEPPLATMELDDWLGAVVAVKEAP